MSRRGNGEGTVYFNKARGRHEGQLDLGVGQNKKRVRRKVTGKTKSQVADKLREVRERELHVRPSKDVRTVSDLLSRWLDTSAVSRVSESTLAGYRYHAECVCGVLGSVRLDHVTPEDVDHYLLVQAKAGYSRATLVKQRSVLGQAVRWGIRRRHISWDVVALAEMPSASVFDEAAPRVKNARVARSLTPDGVCSFVDAARRHRNGTALLIGATVGLRPGEFTALLWDDIDMDQEILQVRRAWKGSGASRALGPPKTSDSVRSIQMPSVIVEALRIHRACQAGERLAAKDWADDDPGLVFTTNTGQPIDPSNLRRLVREVASEAGVGHLTPTDLRHTTTSVLSAKGVRSEVIADLLGHVDKRMVERHYRHQLSDVVDVSVAPMDELLG